MSTENNQGLGMSVIKSGEVAVSAMAAKSKALVEAKFVVAMRNKRNLMEARTKILDACRRPHFARTALYAKPVGGQKMIGPSIRFAETAIQCMTNIDVSTTTIYEDDEKRTINIAVTDLESNLSYGKDVTISKTVERKQLKAGQQAIAQRLNTYNETVYIVAATDDEIQNKIAAQESKVIRNCGLRLVPADIIEEATEIIHETRSKGSAAQDPAAELKKIVDAFNTLNISPVELEKYLGHPLATISPIELDDLRDIYSTVRDGEASWASYVQTKEKDAPSQRPSKKHEFDKAPEGNQEKTTTTGTQPTTTSTKQPELGKQLATPQAELEEFMSRNGIAFDKFRAWAEETDRLQDASSFSSWAELPADFVLALQKDGKAMSRCVTRCKTD